MDMGIEPFLIASSLLGVVGQRLVRRVCPHCVEPYEPTPEERAFYERGGGDPDKDDFVHGVGLQLLRPDRLLRPHRHLRGARGHRRDEGAHRHRRAARASSARSRSSRA